MILGIFALLAFLLIIIFWFSDLESLKSIGIGANVFMIIICIGTLYLGIDSIFNGDNNINKQTESISKIEELEHKNTLKLLHPNELKITTNTGKEFIIATTSSVIQYTDEENSNMITYTKSLNKKNEYIKNICLDKETIKKLGYNIYEEDSQKIETVVIKTINLDN
jgi:hypothetical protein